MLWLAADRLWCLPTNCLTPSSDKAKPSVQLGPREKLSQKKIFSYFIPKQGFWAQSSCHSNTTLLQGFWWSNLSNETTIKLEKGHPEAANPRRGIVFPEEASLCMRDGEVSGKRDADYKITVLYPWCCFLKGFSQ